MLNVTIIIEVYNVVLSLHLSSALSNNCEIMFLCFLLYHYGQKIKISKSLTMLQGKLEVNYTVSPILVLPF